MSRKFIAFSALRRSLRLAAIPLVIASLTACTPSLTANVKRFQSQLPAPAGQTFAVVADDPAMAGGLEFSQYARLVEAQLTRLGYAPASPENATMLVRFDYGVDKGRERIRTTGAGFRDPFWGPWGAWGGGWGGGWGGWGHPRFGPWGGWGYGWNDAWLGGGVESYTVYTSGIEMKIERRADNARLFEGRAEAVSTSNRLGYLVPNLVEAMFTNFPGQSGETVRITVAPEKKKR